MKTEWTFPWKAYDFHFKKEHNFAATVDQPTAESVGRPNGLEAHIQVVPGSETPRDRSIEQLGDVLITLPLRPDEAEPLAYAMARRFGEQIAFRNGDFRIEYGFVTCRRIAENRDEEAELDGKPYSVRLHLEEVVASPEFDGSGITAAAQVDLAVLSEYNQAKRDNNPIRQFLAFFRIMESASYKSVGREPLKVALANNSFLQRHFVSLLPKDSFKEYVDRIVEIRHRCAHLKGNVGFGYAPSDPAVEREIRPELQLLQELAYRCIEGTEP